MLLHDSIVDVLYIKVFVELVNRAGRRQHVTAACRSLDVTGGARRRLGQFALLAGELADVGVDCVGHLGEEGKDGGGGVGAGWGGGAVEEEMGEGGGHSQGAYEGQQ